MVRKLKFHEQKLLRKVNFVNWEVRGSWLTFRETNLSVKIQKKKK